MTIRQLFIKLPEITQSQLSDFALKHNLSKEQRMELHNISSDIEDKIRAHLLEEWVSELNEVNNETNESEGLVYRDKLFYKGTKEYDDALKEIKEKGITQGNTYYATGPNKYSQLHTKQSDKD